MITSTDPAQVGLAQSDTGDVRQAVTNVNAFINTFINTLGTHVGNVVADNGTLHYTPSDPPAAAPGGVSWGEFAAGSLLFKTSASIGSSTLFWMLTAPSAGTATAAAGITQYTAGGPSTWTLGTDGTLIYAPVPEPAEFALMGLGIAALGWYSRRRKKATV